MRAFALTAFAAAALAAVSCDMYLDEIGHLDEPCAYNGNCYHGLLCIQGTCSRTPGLGEVCDEHYCTMDEACEGDLVCFYQDGTHNFPSCGPLPGEGEPCLCDPYGDLVTCDADEEYDLEQIWAGEAHCAEGLGCLDGACVPPMEATVEQPDSTKLWLRCPRGMTWDGWYCRGEPETVLWDDAMANCPDGFQVPTAYDFIEILDGCDETVIDDGDQCEPCESSAACNAMFTDQDLDDSGYGVSYVKRHEHWTRTLDDHADSFGYPLVVDFRVDPHTFYAVDPEIWEEPYTLCVQY